MRKSKKVVFYSMLVCFAFLVAVVVALGNTKPKVEKELVYYTVAVDGPSRIEFEYVPEANAGASMYKVYEYAFGNEMDETLRVMLAKDSDAVAENITIGYYVANAKTIINDNFKFKETLSAVDIDAGGQKWVYVKISADNKDELATFTKDISWVAGKPVDTYVSINGASTALPSIDTGSSSDISIDYSQTLTAPTLKAGEVFAGWYADPFCSTPLDMSNVTPGTEVYANVYTPSTVTEDDWNAPEVAQDYDGNYAEVLKTNGTTASMYDLGTQGCFWDRDSGLCTESSLYVPAYYNGLPVTDVALDGLSSYDYVYIPATVSSLYLYGTVGMEGVIEIDPANPYYVVIDDIFVIERETKTLIDIVGGQERTQLIIPEGVETIGDGGYLNYYGCYGSWSSNYQLTVTIPKTVTRICCYAFAEKFFNYQYDMNDGTITYYGTVVFSDTSTWYVTQNSDYTGGTQISVTNSSKNVSNLAINVYESPSGYADYYWYKLD